MRAIMCVLGAAWTGLSRSHRRRQPQTAEKLALCAHANFVRLSRLLKATGSYGASTYRQPCTAEVKTRSAQWRLRHLARCQIRGGLPQP